jgi:hypothetical protein
MGQEAAAASRGEQVYRERCVGCHGPSGVGVKDRHEAPLAGNKSVLELARYIEKNMPENKPGTCVGEEAEAVAKYIHETFYSPLAQARNRPARIESSRLTGRQFQNVLADLVASFLPSSRPSAAQGLHGEYFDSRRPGDRRVLERIDPEVRFDFGRATPPLAGLETTGFSARWSGSLIAADTGEYEILVRTDHAARLWLNDFRRPLIDAWVKSGSDTEYRARLFLLGGRAYPLKLELTSRKQGVDDSEKKKNDGKPVQTLVELCWKPPVGAPEVIPARLLRPEIASEVFVVRTAFPPDDRSAGYERGVAASKAWDEAATEAALEAAAFIAQRVDELSGGGPAAGPEREAKLRCFLKELVERAFRRPLADGERELYIDRQFAKAADPDAAIKRVVILALKSPRFLSTEVAGRTPDAYAVASRLAFALWDSLPDAALLKAAAAGRLASREQVAAEAERMLDDPRARSKVRQFFLHWLGVDPAPELAKDSLRFPELGTELASDLRTSLELFLDDVIWDERADFRRLLLSSDLYLNGRLARYYGHDLPANAPFAKVGVDPQKHAGVLSHPYIMARFAYSDASSPIHRGVFIVRSLLGRTLRPPPEAAVPLPPNLHPGLTTRERVALQTEPSQCRGCHGMVNPLGFALENFDAAGRYRAQEKGRPIDASGFYEPSAGERKSFRGVRELAEALASSQEVYGALVRNLFHHCVKQPILAYGPETPAELEWIFAASGYNVRELLSEIAATAALAGLPGRGKPELLRAF